MNLADKKNLLKRKAELKDILFNLRTKENELETSERKIHIEKTLLSLKQLDDAIERYEKDLYGYCLLCNDEIDKRILIKYPEKSVCKNCDPDNE